MNTVFFDLETQYTFQELGMIDWESRDPRRLKLAVAGILLNNKPTLFHEDHANKLLSELAKADLIVGHNLLRFDYLALQPYIQQDVVELLQPKTFDMFHDLKKLTGCWISLDDLARRNLGMGKTADGIKIPKMWRDGHREEVMEYLLNDLKITQAVFNHGKKVGKLKYDHKEYGKSLGEREVVVEW
ncbi:hypothetical protein HYU40_03140 [Candidatus Woesearchaeota archaeon]|nr:hypothetical protein [Candidatus Woesearchaeota archaeon]